MMVVTRAGVTSRSPSYTSTDQPTAVARRTTGFHRAFDYVAEATTVTARGEMVTAREYGHTPEGAMARAKAAATARLTGMKHACGFTADGFRTPDTRATFQMGFA